MGRYVGNAAGHAGMVASVVREATTYNQTVSLTGRATAGASPNLLLIFGYQDIDRLWFAGVDITGGVSLHSGSYGPGVVIGRTAGGLPIVEAYDAYVPAPAAERSYKLGVLVTVIGGAAQITLQVNDIGVLVYSLPASSIYDGKLGAGGLSSSVVLQEFTIGGCP